MALGNTYAVLWHIVHLHLGTPVECLKPSKQGLEGVRVQERVILLNSAHIDRKLKICNRDETNSSEIGHECLSYKVIMPCENRCQKQPEVLE
jgi:hypothetical protein